MSTVEIHGPDMFNESGRLRKHLKHLPSGKDCTITVIPASAREVGNNSLTAFLRIYVTKGDDIKALLGAIYSCPELDMEASYDIQVIKLDSFHPRKKK